MKFAIVAAISAFIGTVFDSLLGSVLQVKYVCPSCSALTEKRSHCNTETEYKEGIRFVDNDVVNASSSFITAVIAVVISLILI